MESEELYKPKHKEESPSILKKLDLTCTVCNNEIDSADVNINSTLAKCGHCGSLHFLDDEEFFGRRKRNRPEMMIPVGTEVLHLPSSLDIRTNWSRGKSNGGMWFLTFFTIMWNVAIWPIAISSIMSGAILSLLPMALHLAVGLGLMYFVLSKFINKTDIYVTEQDITITSTPLKNPFTKDIVIPTKNITQLYVTRYVSSTTNGVPNYAYALYAIADGNRRIPLIKGMNKETQLYLEQEIENFLDIDDEKVQGEV
jgi:hypothetical protein